MHSKTLVFCWELGMGNGHVGPFERLARRFLQDGWRVVIIARDLSRVARFFHSGEIDAYQAPFKIGRAVPHIPFPSTFTQLLLNLGYRYEDELRQMVEAWQWLYRHIGPDVILFDHSPTAILAARGLDVPQFTIGHGFYVPVDQQPIACIRLPQEASTDDRIKEEQALVDRINRIQTRSGRPELPRLGALFSELTDNLLTTFRELDHFGPRVDARYFGIWSISRDADLADPPSWPQGDGPKLYAYLKSIPALSELLAWLSQRGVPTIAVLDGASSQGLQQYAGSNIALCDQPVSMDVICRQCDVALTNAGHGTICQLMLSGICQMLVPLTLEQAILSGKVKSLGAGLDARRDQPELIIEYLSMLLDHPDRFGGAAAFRKRYDNWSDEEAIDNVYRAITGA